MEDVLVRITEKITLKDPVLVEGLPGVGNVGKLAVDYLREKLKAPAFGTIHSKFFPPQVYVSEDGIIRLVSNDLYYHRASGSGQRDLILLGGDYQGITPEGQYELTDKGASLLPIIKAMSDFGHAWLVPEHDHSHDLARSS